MPPRDHYSCIQTDTLQERAAMELEAMRDPGKTSNLHRLPTACFRLVKSLPGNHQCIDCGSSHPEWATITYGALLCIECSGRHRGFGVQLSSVRSLTMDHWSHEQVLAMLEGGNEQLDSFFQRHAMSDMMGKRYKTKAARFYRENLGKHVSTVKESGVYQGREASRRSTHRQPLKHSDTV